MNNLKFSERVESSQHLPDAVNSKFFLKTSLNTGIWPSVIELLLKQLLPATPTAHVYFYLHSINTVLPRCTLQLVFPNTRYHSDQLIIQKRGRQSNSYLNYPTLIELNTGDGLYSFHKNILCNKGGQLLKNYIKKGVAANSK